MKPLVLILLLAEAVLSSYLNTSSLYSHSSSLPSLFQLPHFFQKQLWTVVDPNDNYESCVDITHCELQTECECAKLNAKSNITDCRDDGGFVDYLVFHYCTMSNLKPLSYIVMARNTSVFTHLTYHS